MFSPFKGLGELFGSSSQAPKEQKPRKPLSREAKARAWATMILSVILLVIWYGCIALGTATHNDALVYGVMITYFVAFAAVIITYLAYNRGFVNKNVTVDMLPMDWSEEKKQAFVDGNRIRAEKSRWMLTLIIPFVVVFLVECLYLFVWEGILRTMLENWGFVL